MSSMRVLFAYRYGILGGVCTQLINRLGLLSGGRGIEAHLLFAADYGISATLKEYSHLYFEPEPQRVRSLAKEGNFDAVVVIDTPEYFTALADLRGLPLVAEVHTTLENGLVYLSQRSWEPAGFVVPSEYSRRVLRERFRVPECEPIAVVPNCLDMTLFPHIDLPAFPHRPVVAWVGKLDDHKNWRGFLQVASKLAEQTPASEVWMVGGYSAPEGVERELVDEISSRGLADRFRWFPRIEYSAMHRFYAAVRQSGGAVVVTSINESFGMSVLEALVCGCPVVASNVGAIPEIASDRPYLRFYESGDYPRAAALAAELTAEGSNGRVRAALAADRKRLEERFSTDSIGDRYLALLRRFVEGAAESSLRPPAAIRVATGETEQLCDPLVTQAIGELREAIPGGSELGPDPRLVIQETTRLLRGRSYRLARLVAGRDRTMRGLLRLSARLWRELTKGTP